MIEPLVRKYKIVCDRCGKEWEGDEFCSREIHDVIFSCEYRATKGEVCEECYNDFCEIAENFFDEVNRRATDERAKCCDE